MKMMPLDVISHENQLQHLFEPSIFILDVFRTADHAGQIFIPHRLSRRLGCLIVRIRIYYCSFKRNQCYRNTASSLLACVSIGGATHLRLWQRDSISVRLIFKLSSRPLRTIVSGVACAIRVVRMEPGPS